MYAVPFPGDKPFPGVSSGIECPLNDSVGTLLRVDTRVDINPLRDFRYTLKAFDMCYRTRYALKGVMVGKYTISLFTIVRTNH